MGLSRPGCISTKISTTMKDQVLSLIDTGDSQYCDAPNSREEYTTWGTVLLSSSTFDGVDIGISSD